MDDVTCLECRMRRGPIRQELTTLETNLPNEHQMLLQDIIPSHGKCLLPNCPKPTLKAQRRFLFGAVQEVITEHNTLLGIFRHL